MSPPDEIRAIGFTACLQGTGGEAPEAWDESACGELRAALPAHVAVTQSRSGCLLEWSPAMPLERVADEPVAAFKVRVRALLNQAEQEVQASLPPRPAGAPAWALAVHADGHVDAFAIGKVRGIDGDVFLVVGDDAS